MARTTPVHTGYTILNGAGSGPNGNRIDVWAEYAAGSPSVAENYTPLTVYFYAALNPGYSSTTAYAGGLDSRCYVEGSLVDSVSGGDYDFTASSKVNFLGSYSGNLYHDTDGRKTVAISASFTTKSGYITGGSVEGSITLPDIPRRATIESVENALCAQTCRIRWTPAVKSHRFSLKLQVGTWEKSYPNIAPDTTGSYTYPVALPMELARNISGATGKLTLTLTTYQGTTALGSHEKQVNITVPDTPETRPQVTALFQPADTPFSGVYVRLRSKVAAQITAQDPYGAKITGYTMILEGKSYAGQEPVSDYLTGAGEVSVTVSATNDRGFTGKAVYTLSVEEYSQPWLEDIQIFRCDSEGNPQEDGESLYLSATGRISPVAGHNAAALYWRVKPEKGSYTQWQALTAPVVMENTLYKTTPWTVQLQLRDLAGMVATTTAQLPSEQVYMHRPAGGNGMGLGGYVSGQDLLDIYWQINARKPLTAPYINDRGNCADADLALAPGVYRLVSNTNAPFPQGIVVVFAMAGDTAPILQLAVGSVGKAAYRLRWNGAWQSWRIITT